MTRRAPISPLFPYTTLFRSRIQNDLNQLGLTMRDILGADKRTPATAWASQFGRIRADLDDALRREAQLTVVVRDRKSTRLNSSHSQISYAVFCLKKKKCCRM